ncbi:hypothetical protein PPTG_21724 [Phytophthora nicotianae INRA-310]|uniref:Uncharacterized protein n=1 Tax=Phytophthora nicotianae (strain INRA-310) TaxID=761204 RepID=W2QY01_PHYN3|nr:hypothetical protein PPTG_21724 [Phytophthora nicotianae INRA-310]ETN18003.1 hypothetical protein PPTG_21724 [Phytophthora nicotianae INRA-310]
MMPLLTSQANETPIMMKISSVLVGATCYSLFARWATKKTWVHRVFLISLRTRFPPTTSPGRACSS